MIWTVVHGDASQEMWRRPKQSVDCIVTDPPYGETSLGWDVQRRDWLHFARPLLKPHGSVWFFCSLKYLVSIMPLEDWNIAQEIVREKHNGSNFHADRFRRVHEFAVQIYPKECKWSDIYKNVVTTPDATKRNVRRQKQPAHTGYINPSAYTSKDGGPRMMRSVMRVRSCHSFAEHPTQKPLEIVRPLVQYSCPPNGTVLDPFCGSGTTGVVCVSEKRNFLGIESNPEYVEIANRRLAEVQMSLF